MEVEGDCVRGEVPLEGAHDFGEYQGNVGGHGFWEHGRTNGEWIASTDSDARYVTIGQDENRSYGSDVLIVLRRKVPLVEFILLYTVSVGEPGGVENANLGKRLHTPYPLHSKAPALTIMPFVLVNLYQWGAIVSLWLLGPPSSMLRSRILKL